MFKSIGRLPGGERLERIRKSPHYHDGKFINLEPTAVNPDDVSIFKILSKIVSRPDSVRPEGVLPNVLTDLKKLNIDEPVVVWFGHSSYFLQVEGVRVLVDPVFSGTASPFRFFGKAFAGADRYAPQDFPPLDLLILTHDHYDHLDRSSIRNLVPRTKKIITSLGIGSHLELWGVDPDLIWEMDWWESQQVHPGIKITALPTRHFSGRGIKRNKTLWSAYYLELGGYKLFIGGDSGYSDTFKRIGDQLGPFDLAFLECGQYGKYWPQIHMYPEQTLMAGKDLQARLVMPVHWGKFVLSTHPWNEPIERFVQMAEREGIPYTVPRIGEPFFLNQKPLQEKWWI